MRGSLSDVPVCAASVSSASGEESYRHGRIASREFLFDGRGAYTYTGCDEQRTRGYIYDQGLYAKENNRTCEVFASIDK